MRMLSELGGRQIHKQKKSRQIEKDRKRAYRQKKLDSQKKINRQKKTRCISIG